MNKNLILNITEKRINNLYCVDFVVNFTDTNYHLFELSDGVKFFPSEIKQLIYDCGIDDLNDLSIYHHDLLNLECFEDIYYILQDTFTEIKSKKNIGFEINDNKNGEVYESKI